jgi:hypothetical protein
VARPVVSTLTEELYEALGFYTTRDEEFDYPLLRFCAAWVETLIDPVYEVVRDRDDGRPGWAILLDPDEAPVDSLFYLARYVGARLQPAWSEAQCRAEIKQPTTWRRGQTETMRTAIQATLTGTQRVVVRERTPEPHSLYVRTLASETPDEARTAAAVATSKVAGLLADYEPFDGYTLDDEEANFATLDAEEAVFTTLDEILEADLP